MVSFRDVQSALDVPDLRALLPQSSTSRGQTASGKVGPTILYMPSQPTMTTLTLKKGLVRGASLSALYSWINSTKINQIQKKDIIIRLMDETGTAVISWKVMNAFPTKLDAPTFDANSNDVAVESMTLTADTLIISEA
jgi:phage tail-like protein